VDGLKTGYIDESGYNLAVTAEREGRRLLAVLMGGPGKDSREGSLIRAVDATALLSYGFYATRNFIPDLPPLPDRRVYKGSRRSASFTVPEPPRLTLAAEEAGALSWEFQWQGPLTAPLTEETSAGLLICRGADGRVLFTRPLLVRESIAPGSFWRRFWDGLVLKIRGDRA
jgi:D-alanyl-D-alanine carboxypeptidase (penicillin-binding protein 5/6)